MFFIEGLLAGTSILVSATFFSGKEVSFFFEATESATTGFGFEGERAVKKVAGIMKLLDFFYQ